ncbi:hypothetical protein GCM10022420_030440 [Streptomyces iranensis]
MRLRKRCGGAGGAIRGRGEQGSGSRRAAGPELTGNVSDMALQGSDEKPRPPPVEGGADGATEGKPTRDGRRDGAGKHPTPGARDRAR